MTSSEFDRKATDWDKNPTHILRANAVAKALLARLPLHNQMKGLEVGAGTGLLSFALHDKLGSLTLLDNSQEMTLVCTEKIRQSGINNMKAMFFDLEKQDFDEIQDIIYSQMVMHHMKDVEAMIVKFYKLLNPMGFVAIADLYSEDGSFHGEGFNGHFGFDIAQLRSILLKSGFVQIQHETCFVLSKTDKEGGLNKYPIFLLTAAKTA